MPPLRGRGQDQGQGDPSMGAGVSVDHPLMKTCARYHQCISNIL